MYSLRVNLFAKEIRTFLFLIFLPKEFVLLPKNLCLLLFKSPSQHEENSDLLENICQLMFLVHIICWYIHDAWKYHNLSKNDLITHTGLYQSSQFFSSDFDKLWCSSLYAPPLPPTRRQSQQSEMSHFRSRTSGRARDATVSLENTRLITLN